MRVLYLSDNPTEFRNAYYYDDWISLFVHHHDVTLWGPGYSEPSREDIDGAELLIVGHGAFNVFVESGYTFELRKKRNFFSSHNDGYYGSAIRNLSCPKIFFSKNDYKYVLGKSMICKNEGIKLLITNSRSTIPEFAEHGVLAEWIPFGVDLGVFKDYGLDKTIDIGFRGNLNSVYNGGIRERLIAQVGVECADLNLDLVTSDDGENFLIMEDYARWINRCSLIVNTVSACETVGPKWWEEMACGSVPLAPENDYEGLFEPDVHYLSVKPDFSNLRSQIDRFFSDKDFKNNILQNCLKIVQSAEMENRYQELSNVLKKTLLCEI